MFLALLLFIGIITPAGILVSEGTIHADSLLSPVFYPSFEFPVTLSATFVTLGEPSHDEVRWLTTCIPGNDVLDLTDIPRVNQLPDTNTNPYVAKHMLLLLWAKQGAAEMEELLQLVEDGAFEILERKISDQLRAITQRIAPASNHTTAVNKHLLTMQQEFIKLLELVKNGNYEELHRLLLIKKLKILQVRKFLIIMEQLSPRELAEAFDKATKQRAQQVEKQIERIHQIQEREGAPILRTRQEVEDERLEEIRLLFMFLILWFLLYYCSDGTVWCVDVELSFGLSLVLSEIVLLLGGDIEKNPGPLTGILVCCMCTCKDEN